MEKIQCTGLHVHTQKKISMQKIFFGNCLLDHKIVLSMKKYKKIWLFSKILGNISVVVIKKKPVVAIMYGNCMISVFLLKI